MYGTQTIFDSISCCVGFENDVEMYGTQTACWTTGRYSSFENDVEMYGTQTVDLSLVCKDGV